MPSTICPVPTAHTPASAHAMYLKKKKEMPGLTPAAWRKAAAQEMGLDYDTYLALWKANKGASKVAQTVGLVPESTPTVPAAASSSPTMGIVPKVLYKYEDYFKGMTDAGTNSKVLDELIPGGGDYLDDPAFKKIAIPPQAELYAGQDVALDSAKIDSLVKDGFKAWDPEDPIIIVRDSIGRRIIVDGHHRVVASKITGKGFFAIEREVNFPIQAESYATDFGELVDDVAWKPTSTLPTVQANEVQNAFLAGKISADEAVEHLLKLKNMFPEGSVFGKTVTKMILDLSPNQVATEVGEAVIDTHLGPLTHDLAQSVYKKMKAEMPGASPATLRHAAAEYLNVDYNDYLKAWKKPTTAAQAAKQVPLSKMPPNTSTPLSASKVGKYSTVRIEADALKDELGKAFGPGANKAYINLSWDQSVEGWSTQFPTSLLPTQAAKDAVVEKLEALGLNVSQNGSTYTIKSGSKAVKAAAKAAKSDGIFTMADGTQAWDATNANKWSESWWRTLTERQKQAVRTYTGSGYHSMNGELRRGAGASAISADLSSAMRAMDHEFTVFRGTDIPISQFIDGGMWEDKGFMSTAIYKGSGWPGLKFEIVIPKGTKGAYVDPFSSHRGENEFIIDKGTKFRVLSVDRVKRIVKMVAIPH